LLYFGFAAFFGFPGLSFFLAPISVKKFDSHSANKFRCLQILSFDPHFHRFSRRFPYFPPPSVFSFLFPIAPNLPRGCIGDIPSEFL
jgi:hypothetical protein